MNDKPSSPILSLDVIFAGSGEFGLPSLAVLQARGHRVVQIVSQPDRPAGRGHKLLPTPVSQFALKHNLPLTRTADINAEKLVSADILVVIAFGQKIAPLVVNHARLGSVNLHASKLPKLRGAAPINWAILRGDSITGNSVIRLAQKMDAGAVLAQSEVYIGELETAGELHDRLAEDGAPLLLGVLDALAAGSALEILQDESAATMAPKLNREAARLDWLRSAAEIARQIRGLHPWPGCHVRLLNESGEERARLTLVRARNLPDHSATPGLISSVGLIGAGDGKSVEILEVQPEGKRPMPLAAYRNGHPWQTGWRLESF